MKIKKCDVCGKDIKVDDWENGACKNCGWNNDEDAIKYPNAINPPNFTSLNEAKNNYKNNVTYKPTFDRVAQLVDRVLDIIIKYKKSLYQLSKHDDYTLWKINTKDYQSFKSLQELKNNAKVDNSYLKDIWQEISDISYDCWFFFSLPLEN